MPVREKGFHLGEWMGYALGVLTLLGLFAGSVAWVNSTSVQVAKISGIENQVHTLYIWARLADSANFKRAEMLTKYGEQ